MTNAYGILFGKLERTIVVWRPNVLYMGNLVTLSASQKVQGGMEGLVDSELGRVRHGLIEGHTRIFKEGLKKKSNNRLFDLTFSRSVTVQVNMLADFVNNNNDKLSDSDRYFN
jgi:hypothetical protein